MGGATLSSALEALIQQRPGLAYHLFVDARPMRRHILCFCNDEYRRGRAVEDPYSKRALSSILHVP